jgi:hypothetical protein
MANFESMRSETFPEYQISDYSKYITLDYFRKICKLQIFGSLKTMKAKSHRNLKKNGSLEI